MTDQAEVEIRRLISPSVAVVSCLKRISDTNPDAASLPRVASLSYVVSKGDDESWRIALTQTTPHP